MKLHICIEHPCPLKDKECSDILKNGFTVSFADEVMPRAGICNKCTQLLAGMEHCRGKEMGCNCDCKCKHLDADWEMHKERADRKRLDTGTCIKCGEQVRKVTNIYQPRDNINK